MSKDPMPEDRINKTVDQFYGQAPNDELQLKVGKLSQNGLTTTNTTTSTNPVNSAVLAKNEPEDIPDVKISNIIGDFGPYQIAVIIFAALRAMACAMDGLSGPFLSPNIKNFQCDVCDIPSPPSSNNATAGVCSIFTGDQVKTRYEIDSGQCFFENPDSLRPDRIVCNKWTFNYPENERLMNTLTIEQSLVCDREWLKSLSNSMYFVGATLGLLFWGIISDKYGRRTAYVCSHFMTIIFGFSAIFANSMWSYIILRSINSFGMIGELIPRSIQLEMVATEYRFICSVICQIGWATGIILVPALAYFNPDYRFILSIPLGLSLIMLPWLLYLPESARWLITSKQYDKARAELVRAARINGKLSEATESQIERYNRQVQREEATTSSSGKRIGLWRAISAIFTNLHLLKDTVSVFILLFVAEVVYFSLTLNVADLGGSLYVNYVISGLTELVSIAFCGTLLAYLSRRMCLSLLLLASTVSYLLLSLVNVYEDYLSMTVILTVNAFGKLTAIGNLMIIILVSQEVFPTVIRQFGTSLCITVGKAGSAVAPFTHELGQIIGQSWCFAMFSLICLSCAVIPFVLSETGNRELPDTVVDVEEGADNARRKRRQTQQARGRASSVKSGKYIAAHFESNDSISRLKSQHNHHHQHHEDMNNNNSSMTDLNNKSNGFGSFNHSNDTAKQIDLNNNDNNNNDGANEEASARNFIMQNRGTSYHQQEPQHHTELHRDKSGASDRTKKEP